MGGHEVRRRKHIYWDFSSRCTDFLASLGLHLGIADVIFHPVTSDLTVGTGSLTPDLTVGPVNPDSMVGTGLVFPDIPADTGTVSIVVMVGTGSVTPDNPAVNTFVSSFDQRTRQQWLGTGCFRSNYYKSVATVAAVVIPHFVWLFGTDQSADTALQ